MVVVVLPLLREIVHDTVGPPKEIKCILYWLWWFINDNHIIYTKFYIISPKSFNTPTGVDISLMTVLLPLSVDTLQFTLKILKSEA